MNKIAVRRQTTLTATVERFINNSQMFLQHEKSRKEKPKFGVVLFDLRSIASRCQRLHCLLRHSNLLRSHYKLRGRLTMQDNAKQNMLPSGTRERNKHYANVKKFIGHVFLVVKP